jgi:dienelactone hydrolase
VKTHVWKLVRSLCVMWLAAIGFSLTAHGQSAIQFSASSYNVTEGAPEATICVQRNNDLDTVVSVDFATTNLTATAGADYTEVSTRLTFLAGETNKLVRVPILNDELVETIETFQAALSNPTGGAILGVRTNAIVQITDNDKGLDFEFPTYSVAEDAGAVLIGVTRGDDGNSPMTVDYVTTNVTAVAGQDYQESSGRLTFAPGEKVKLFTVPILNDSLKEATKTFLLTLSNPTGGGVLGSQSTATVTIIDNDPGVQFVYSQYWVQENEGTLTVKVLRGNDLDLPPFTVDFATSNVTAVASQDYTETRGTLAFGVGETVKTITVPITYDEQKESLESFMLILSNPSGGIVPGPKHKAMVRLLDTAGMAAHRLNRISVLPDQSVQLVLAGGVSERFSNYFDLYPIEVSSNLVDWTPLVTLQRTNSSTNAFTYTDSQAGTSNMRFYRTFGNNLITPLRKPTGPFAVGVNSRLLTDPTRRNRYGIATNGSFMVSIWYPAVQEPGRFPSPLTERQLAQDPAVVGSFTDRIPYFVGHTFDDAQCAPNQTPYPIVLLSPGWWVMRSAMAELSEDLASHGYIVAVVDHFDVMGTVFPDGTYLKGDTTDAGRTLVGFQDRVKDLRFVMEELVRCNDADPTFRERLDLTKVAAIGMSWGGGVAGEFGRTDDRVKAVVLLDAYLQHANDLVRAGLTKPFLSMYSTEAGGETALFNKAAKEAIWFKISSTGHANFHDWYWWSYPDEIEAGREAARTRNSYTVWFLDKYLKGSTEPMPSLADYPRVINFKQK